MSDFYELELNRMNSLLAPGLTTQRNIKLIDIMSVSDEPNKKWNHTSFWGRVLLRFPILRAICCLDEGNLKDVMFDIEIRDQTREAMKQHTQAIGNTGIETEMMVIYKETGYDLGRCAEKYEEELARQKAAQTKVDANGTDNCGPAGLSDAGLTSTALGATMDSGATGCSVIPYGGWSNQKKVVKHRGRVQLVPAFIAAVTMALRSKFGHMTASEANRLLIEREYLKMCRESNVRQTDMNHSRQFVLNTFFNETLMEEVALSRPRMPAWVRRLFAREQTTAPTVC